MSSILNEINLMKYLSQYKRGVVISEQSINITEDAGSKPGQVICVKAFQTWVKNTKGDSKILGTTGDDGDWGPNTKLAFDKYGIEYGNSVISKLDTRNFQNYVKNVKKDSSILGPTGVDGDWGSYTRKAWKKYGASYLASNCTTISSGSGGSDGGSDGTKDNTNKNCKKTNIKKFENVNTCLADSTKSVKLGVSEVTDCAAFVNAFSKKSSYVGNAWFSHDLDSAGRRKFSVYTKVPENIKTGVRQIFNGIWAKGGWPKAGNSYSENVKRIQEKLVPNQASLRGLLSKGDIVGIYYPPSSHHVEAFYQSATGKDGKGNMISNSYVKSDSKNNMVKGSDGFPALGKTWASGRIWSPNTHLGVVGEIKNGVPIIFHNIGGTVWADPLGKLQGNGKIMWIKQA